MDRNEVEGMLLTTPSNFAWLTGGGNNYVSVAAPRGAAWLLVMTDGAYLLADNIELPRLTDEEPIDESFERVSWPWHDSAEPARSLEALAHGRRVFADTPTCGLPAAADGFAELRYTLNASELVRYRKLGHDAAKAVEQACHCMRPGMTEHEVAGILAYACRESDVLPLVALVAFDERISRYRHPLPTGATVDRIAMVVLTGWRAGLHASLTRMVSFGDPGNERWRAHEAVTAVDARLILESRAGRSLGAVLRAGLDEYGAQDRAGEWRNHHQGGLTGYAGREIFAVPESEHVLEECQVVAWNPSITGAKSEDTVAVTARGPEVLTRTGDWPECLKELPCGRVRRPDILVRSST